MSDRFDYVVEGRTYCQVELGSARAALVMPFIMDAMTAAGGDHRQILAGLLRHAAAIVPLVLLDEGMSEMAWLQAQKNPRWLEERTMWCQATVPYTQALEVLQDFLACNPIGLWLDRAAGVLERFTQILSTPPASSNGSAPSAPAATPPAATPSAS